MPEVIRYGLFGRRTRTEYRREIQKYEKVDDCWVLMTRFWQKTEPLHAGRGGKKGTETTKNSFEYCLTLQGGLVVRSRSWSEMMPGSGGYWETDPTVTVATMSATDVEAFDFEPAYKTLKDRRVTVTTDREPDRRRLKVRAKGEGMSRALKALLP